MGIWQIIHELVLGPIELLLDVIYALSMKVTFDYGKSIIVLSLVVNTLLLPLYKRADALQKEEQKRTIRMKPGIDQIRAKFSGNERFMVLQIYYRQNHYKPYYALKGSISLLLQIPFFMAAYAFLSHLKVLQGVPFGPIWDLSLPDGLLQIGGISINILPILMTLINIASGMLYSKGLPVRSKIQMFGLAGIFLVLLYNSPSGLVVYWTMNNIFSLGKNFFARFCHKERKTIRNPEKISLGSRIRPAQCKGIFWFSCVFLAVLTGLLIPSAVIKSSVAEFLDIRYLMNPIRYLLHSFLLAAGFFILWCGIYFSLSSERTKRIFAVAFAALAAVSAVNFICFGTSYGDLSSQLRYQNPLSITADQKWINVLVTLVVIAVIVLLIRRFPGLLRATCAAFCVALIVVSAMNISAIQLNFREHETLAGEVNRQSRPTIHLSKTGKNVVVMMLDRAIGGFVPFIMNEKPELMRQFDGFTYYPNTLSFGFHTNVASPALYGGYEYTPDGMAERSDMKLVEKHNEALKVMPVLFRENGYDVTVMDQSMANYQTISDLSIYDDYPDIHRYNAIGYFTEDLAGVVQHEDEIINRNMFCYSIFRISPPAIHTLLYDDGKYNETDATWNLNDDSEDDLSGIEAGFINNYMEMQNLSVMTEALDEGDCFLLLTNEETHELTLLQEPDYIPKTKIDNDEYEEEHGIRSATDGRTLDIASGDVWLKKHYQCNMCAFLQLGRWFDWLRENGVWDNTRIVLVADHAYPLGVFGLDLTEKYPEVERYGKVSGEAWTDTMAYEPLLMVKDFNAEGLVTDDTFMTNADTPVLSTAGLITNPVNPFTGNPITDEGKKTGELHLIESDWHIEANNGYKFSDPQIITFRGQNVFDIDNWNIER